MQMTWLRHKKGIGETMRLAQGIVIEKDKTFGTLKFSALRREVKITDEEGNVTEQIKERTYDLKSKGQGRMIQVSIPASAGVKNFDYNAEVELVNPVADTVATATYIGADVDWYIKAENIILKKSTGNQPNSLKQNQDNK